MAINATGIQGYRMLLILFCVLPILTGGCKDGSSNPPAEGMIRITPSELFTGELKKIEAHVASTNGCVEIEYVGPREWFIDRTVLWQHGKAREIMSGRSISLNGHMSFSLHDVQNYLKAYDDTLGFKFIQAGLGGSSRTYLPKCPEPDGPDSYLAGTALKLSGPVEVPDDEEIAIWGYAYQWRPGKEWDRGLSIEEQAKRADWAVVVMISMRDEE